jgi:uncharacterized protein
VTADDLSAPLGQSKSRKSRLRVPRVLAPAITGVLTLVLLFFAGWVLLVDDPFGGEPRAVVAAHMAAAPPQETPAEKQGTAAPPAPPAPAAPPAPPAGTTVTIIDGMSGKRQDVTIGAGRKQADAAPSPEAGRPPPASRMVPIEPRLAEITANGPIPKIGPDGVRPADVFAHAPNPPGPSGPRIAIVVSGLGIGANATTEALTKLPAAVTFAFSPYGSDVDRLVSRARGEGHEILMQVPMEPLDYPDNDPGPRTLMTSIGAEQNLDRLHWFMSRCQGYVGIANYMGARFTANEPAIAPVLSDIAKRGLIYFDDSSSPRSLAVQLSGANNGAFAKANVVLDAVPIATEIDSALSRLETLARIGGVGIGVASALPVSIDRIAQWVKAAENRGLALVPISVVASRPKSS